MAEQVPDLMEALEQSITNAKQLRWSVFARKGGVTVGRPKRFATMAEADQHAATLAATYDYRWSVDVHGPDGKSHSRHIGTHRG